MSDFITPNLSDTLAVIYALNLVPSIVEDQANAPDNTISVIKRVRKFALKILVVALQPSKGRNDQTSIWDEYAERYIINYNLGQTDCQIFGSKNFLLQDFDKSKVISLRLPRPKINSLGHKFNKSVDNKTRFNVKLVEATITPEIIYYDR
ncbi:hypothetical protein CHS0354_036786 [Potamilus streckersoni]|uniref:Uncharacterized protein n=1 Tax=Potamilus streckersoni TaxID=2493646 RepID=A0AAE0SYN4_9BIVA|nr:hypothetical protein CHS0354_036786 [Potamilus streckersoni]